jgi:hypothetical protein
MMEWNDRRQDKVQQVQGLRKSNAAGKHGDRRTKRNRDRSAQKRSALRDQE